MAAGSRKKFALDLNDIIAFPDAAHMPVFPPTEKESWVLLMEVRNIILAPPIADFDCRSRRMNPSRVRSTQ